MIKLEPIIVQTLTENMSNICVENKFKNFSMEYLSNFYGENAFYLRENINKKNKTFETI